MTAPTDQQFLDNLAAVVDGRYVSDLFTFLLSAPARAFASPELGKRLSMPPAQVSAASKILEKAGLAKIFVKKQQRYLILNTKSSQVQQLRQYAAKNFPKYEDELFEAALKVGDIKGLFLSGLFTGQILLPVDILFVGTVNEKKLEEFLDHAQKLMGQELNYTIMAEMEFRIRRGGFDRFIKDIFDYPHVVVKDAVRQK
jgi:hypothetical protein